MFTLVIGGANRIHAALYDVGDDVADVGDKTAFIQQWELVWGFFFPAVMHIVIQKGWSRAMQAAVAFVLIWASTFIKQALGGDFDFTQWWTSSLTVFAVAIPAYKGFWEPTGIGPRIEAATGGDSVETQEARKFPNHLH
jgi:hypothetical protein